MENRSLSFLDIKISRENNKLMTSVYCKPTFSGIFTNFESFIPDIYKCRVTETLLHKSFRLCSHYENFHQEMETLKSILNTIVIPYFVNHCIKIFLNKLSIQWDFNFVAPKRELICILPYLGNNCLDLKVMKRAASCKHRQAIKTRQCEKKLFNLFKLHLHSS